jgi:kinesin family protein 3/17
MEDKLAREAEELRRRSEEKKRAIEAQKNLAEDERLRLLEELSKKEERQRRAKENQQKLLRKLKAMEDQLNQGSQIMDQATRQEQELQMAKLQLDERRRQENQLAQELRAQEEEWGALEQRYNSRQEHVEDLNKKLKKLWVKVQGTDTEVRDVQQEFQREKEDMLDTVRYLNQQIKLRTVIIDHFVPQEEVQRVEKYAAWNEEEEEYFMPPPERVHLANPIKRQGSAVGLKKPTSEYARIARGLGENCSRFKHEDILTLDLDLPDRTTEDYTRVVSDQLRDVILSTLNDIDDDMSFVSIESYRGEDTAKRSRPSTAKRPGTATRKRAAEVVEAKPNEAAFPKSRGLVKPR